MCRIASGSVTKAMSPQCVQVIGKISEMCARTAPTGSGPDAGTGQARQVRGGLGHYGLGLKRQSRPGRDRFTAPVSWVPAAAGHGWTLRCSERSCQNFQIRVHHVGHAADLGITPDVVTGHALLAPGLA